MLLTKLRADIARSAPPGRTPEGRWREQALTRESAAIASTSPTREPLDLHSRAPPARLALYALAVAFVRFARRAKTARPTVRRSPAGGCGRRRARTRASIG